MNRMLSVTEMQLTQADLAKQGPMWVFVLVMTLTGSLVNQFPDSQQEMVNIGKDVDCKNSRITVMSQQQNISNSVKRSGLFPEYVSGSLVFLLPLLPLMVPPFDDDKLQMIAGHLVGQPGSFGSSELARHFIVSPEVQFLSKCNISQHDCLLFENTSLLLKSSMSNKTFCHNSALPFYDLFNSLHGSPHVPSVMVGASMVAFFLAVKYRRQKQHNSNEKNEKLLKYCIKALLMIASFMIVTLIVIDCYINTNQMPIQIGASVIYGILLQALVYGFFKKSKMGNVMLSVKLDKNVNDCEASNNVSIDNAVTATTPNDNHANNTILLTPIIKCSPK